MDIIFVVIALVVVAALALVGGMTFGKNQQRQLFEAENGRLKEYAERLEKDADRERGEKLRAAAAEAKETLRSAKSDARETLGNAKAEAKDLIRSAEVEAKDMLLKAKADAETEVIKLRKESDETEKRLRQREAAQDKRIAQLDKREESLRSTEKELDKDRKTNQERSKEIDALIAEGRKKLQEVAGLSPEEAKERLIKDMEEEAKLAAARRIKVVEEQAQDEAEKRAKRIVGIAMQRYAGEYVAERAISVVELPNDEMKGRIIGREGRNIRAIEAAAGVDIIIDDTPESVVVSAFDPVRREIARQTLEQLIADGRIHPARIEEVVEKTRKEMDQNIKEAGEQALIEMGLHGLHPELVRLLGRLKWRTSYTQNQWQHSVEVGFLCGAMAAELGLNVKQARRAGLLHDIGKAMTHEIEGSHAVIGADFARKHGESPEIVHAIMSHHADEEPQTLLANLVIAADAISGARPGARRERMDSYIKRLEDLEKIASDFKGVGRAFAVQAGRELRVMVESKQINDEGISVMSHEIAQKIESEMTYPGQIKVVVIRETRASDFAR